MRTPEDETKTRGQIEAIADRGVNLTAWEKTFVKSIWKKLELMGWVFDTEASKIEQIYRERCK